ncbi:MAG: hypothetical protein Fur0024_5380 [Patescibacteria group bacterium]
MLDVGNHLIPDNAKKVFTGVIFNVWQWEQTLFNGRKAIFERITRPDNVQILAITEDKKIIFLEEEQPARRKEFKLPMGRDDHPGETPEECAKRELFEETGFVPEKIFLWTKKLFHNKIAFWTWRFVGLNCKKVADQNLDKGGEKISIKFLTFDEMLELTNDEGFCEYSPDFAIELLKAKFIPEKKEILKKMLGL